MTLKDLDFVSFQGFIEINIQAKFQQELIKNMAFTVKKKVYFW